MFQKPEHPERCFTSKAGDFHPQLPGWFCPQTDRFSLKTKDRDAAEQIIAAKNQAIRQPTLNRQIAKAYLSGTDAGMSSRTWQTALEAMVERKQSSTRERWVRGIKNHALDLIRHCVIVETQPELLWQTLKAGTVSTNVHLRELHNSRSRSARTLSA